MNSYLPIPENDMVFEMLLSLASENGRDQSLFGGCIERARKLIKPFVIGDHFPDIYLECPLKEDPFLDVTVLYTGLPEGVCINSKYASGSDELISCFTEMRKEHSNICFGFELDTSKEDPKAAAVHFEPREHTELAAAFCHAAGEDKYGRLYCETAAKLTDTFPPSFFGMFRGRSDSPLRVCGYLGLREKKMIIEDTNNLVKFFDTIGFGAYDDKMLEDITKVLKLSPIEADYQFDIYPDRSVSDVFSIDIMLAEKSARSIRQSYQNGSLSRIMSFFRDRDIADARTDLISELATSFAFPVIKETGDITGFALVIQPSWFKVRWKGAKLQNAKSYSLLRAGCVDHHL